MLNVTYALMASDVDGLVNRTEVRDKLDALLEETVAMGAPETWGMSDRAQASLRAAEGMFGPR